MFEVDLFRYQAEKLFPSKIPGSREEKQTQPYQI